MRRGAHIFAVPGMAILIAGEFCASDCSSGVPRESFAVLRQHRGNCIDSDNGPAKLKGFDNLARARQAEKPDDFNAFRKELGCGFFAFHVLSFA